MTSTTASVDAERAADIDAAHVAWGKFPLTDRPTFGAFTVNYLRERGLSVLQVGPPPYPLSFAEVLEQFRPQLPNSPHLEQALTMTVEQLADLLATLAERGLHWTPGENGERGTLHEGPPEPRDLHVVFDCFRAAWQRDDAAAADAPHHGHDGHRWFGPSGTVRTWDELLWAGSPLTPDGGIAPPAAGDDGCEGGPR